LIAHEMAVQLDAAGQRVGPMLFIDPPLPPREQRAPGFLAKLGVLSVASRVMDRPGLRRVLARSGVTPSKITEPQMRVWLQFRLAAYNHKAAPYAGPVQVVGSRARLAHFHTGRWARYLTGSVQLLEIGSGHRDVFHPANPQAALFVRTYTETCRAWFAEHGGSVHETAARQSQS
jgi:thioesterase domain-containing protein